MADTTLFVPDIHCDHCKDSLEGAVGDLQGVDRAQVSIDDRSIAVTFEPALTDMAHIVDAIEGQGYFVEDQ